ncbi:hypothetical protein PTKIN_Ptkin18bG0043300 [Pterospermum kingtungense]
MQELFTIFTVLFIVTPGLGSATDSFNVIKYGAVGNGKTDDSTVNSSTLLYYATVETANLLSTFVDNLQAFLRAWKAACKSPSRNPSLIVPASKTFLLKPVTFSGPCKSSSIQVLISGNVVAPNSKLAWEGYYINRWLAFTNVKGLMISGSGTINGRGSAWWPQPCLYKGVTCKGPTALTFDGCQGLVLKGLRHVNSQRNHITITSCEGVTISNLHISAPATSPNTDGIDVSDSRNVQIRNSFIGTGDDCVAISSGSSHINITGIVYPTFMWLNIGALGVHGENDTVEEVHVRNCTFKGSLTGVRIKTWQGGVGYARKISFEKIRFIRADSPIIIDQYYCPSGENCKNETSGVKIGDVSYSSIIGTSTTEHMIMSILMG